MALPDFLLIGAMKCGTTTLAAQIAAQPGAFISTPKEPNFFSDDGIYAKGMTWYEALFDGATPGQLCGEASTHYTKLPTYPKTLARIATHLAAPKLVYMVRDPIERALSHYIHEWSQGIMGADPIVAFKQHSELVDYGRYAMQIRPYLSQFGAEAVILTSLERWRADPQAELNRIAAHIGLSEPVTFQTELGAQNVSADRVRKLPFHALLVDNAVATALRRTLVPKSLRSRIRQSRQMGQRPEMPEALKVHLHAIFAEDLADLAQLFPGTNLGFEDHYRAVALP